MQKVCNRKWILGLSYGHHESSCTAISNTGEIVFLREEWLTRVKLDYRFPKSSINFLLKNYIKDETIITVAHFQKPVKNWISVGTKKGLSAANYMLKIRQFRNSDIFIEKELKTVINKKFDLIFCPHHLSHAIASSQFTNKKNVTYLVLDGYGDDSSGAIFDKNFNTLKTYKAYQSLGILYSAITEWAGFVPNEDEYKVMAIAAYGKPIYKDFILKNIIKIELDDICINEDYFNFHDISESPLKKLFFKKFKKYNSKTKNQISLDENLCNVISSFQVVIEEIVKTIISNIIKNNKNTEQIVCTGGLFHNSVLVGKLNKIFDIEIITPPCPGDPGSSIGAAFFGSFYNKLDFYKNNLSFKNKKLNPFIGPHTESLENYPKLFNKITKSLNESLLLAESILQNNQIFSTYDGRMEIGPRALGSRSLICNAISEKSVKNLNEVVKKRESFRPLAIMLNEHNFKKVFGNQNNSKLNTLEWMGQVNWASVKKRYAFLHHDNSSRPQIIRNKNCSIPKLLNILLIERNYILCNTSFNIAGDPMVFSVEDVYINMIRMGIKYIYSNNLFYEVIDENSF